LLTHKKEKRGGEKGAKKYNNTYQFDGLDQLSNFDQLAGSLALKRNFKSPLRIISTNDATMSGS